MQPPDTGRFPWNLDWNLLRTFIVVVEQRGISKAAGVLGLKQPSVSAALKRLETAVGRRLIIRKPNEFVVTRAGQRLYSECTEIFSTVSQLPTVLSEEVAELRGHLSFVVTSSVSSTHFDDMLHGFASAHPGVTYSFDVQESDEVESMIARNRASFGICLLSALPGGLNRVELYREFFGLYCGPRHPLFNAATVSPADLEGEPFVAFQTETPSGPLEQVSRLRHRLKLSPQWRGVSSSLNEIRRMIIAGIGIGALPVHVAQQDVTAGRIRQLPPYSDLPCISIYLISNPARRLTEAESAFLDHVHGSVEAIPDGERVYGG